MNENKRYDIKETTDNLVCTGYFNGFSIEIRCPEEMTYLYKLGGYGKGSFSKSKPNTITGTHKILRQRQFLNRNMLMKRFKSSEESSSNQDVSTFDNSSESNCGDNGIIVVVPDSESDDENYIENLKPKCYTNNIKVVEKLILSPQEAFYLAYKEKHLKIVNENDDEFNREQIWDIFTTIDSNFIWKYVVYDHYRGRGLIVKPGIKFGGDYVLYSDKPSKVHANQIVLINYNQEKYKVDWCSILGHIRMASTTVKDILWVDIKEDCDRTKTEPNNMSHYTVQDVLLKREMQNEVKDNDDLFCFIYIIPKNSKTYLKFTQCLYYFISYERI